MSVSNGLQAENVEESKFGGVSSKKSIGELMETRIRSKRSVVKRRITTTLRKLEELISKTGSKTMIKGYVNNLSEYLKEAESLNNELLAFVHENEHELVLYSVADTRGGGRRGAQAPPIILTEALVLKSGSTDVFILRSGTVAYYLVQYFALLLSWLQQFVRLCVTLCNLVT